MAIKTFKPTTPSRRHMTVSAFEGIDKKAKPERSLVESQKKHAGRNSYGRITVRHHGGGNKQKYRIIDFKRDKMDVPATVRMPSGEMRKIRMNCYATIGQVGNIDHANVSLGKAGRVRHMGWRPKVRGSVMNPCDHPHGGGEGKSPVGRPGPVTPWGKPTLGYKTRKKKNPTDKMIVKRRNAK